jgi:hypothetical protein
VDPEPGKNLMHVQLYRSLGDAELLRNRLVREPEGGKLGYFTLAARELHVSSLDVRGRSAQSTWSVGNSQNATVSHPENS